MCKAGNNFFNETEDVDSLTKLWNFKSCVLEDVLNTKCDGSLRNRMNNEG